MQKFYVNKGTGLKLLFFESGFSSAYLNNGSLVRQIDM